MGKRQRHVMFGRVKPRYYVIKKASLTFSGYAYWDPRPCDVEKYGVERKALGHHSFGAMALADQHNQKLDALRNRESAERFDPNPYARGTFGKFYWKWTHRPAFYKLARDTQGEWERVWRRLEPRFAHRQLSQITPGDIESYADQLDADPNVTHYTRWRTINKLREIFNAAVAYQLIQQTPCGTIDNPAPDGRHQIFKPWEMMALINKAKEIGQINMWLAIRVMYEAALSPVDAHTLTPDMLIKDADGFHIRRERTKLEGRKNKRPGLETSISAELYNDLMAHAAPDGAIPHPKARIILADRTGKPYVFKSKFSSDFKAVRDLALPEENARPREKQRFAIDIRRTANVEAELGGASREDRAKFLANSIDKDDRLHTTYTPATAAATRRIQKLREEGRKALGEAKPQEKAG